MKYDNSKVRRQDRLLPQERAFELLGEGEYGFFAMTDGEGGGYGIPLSYVMEGDHIYFHCAPEGRKLHCLAAGGKVTFTVVGRTAVQSDKYTTLYESVMARGIIGTVEDNAEKMRVLGLLISKYSRAEDVANGIKYAAASLARTKILCMAVETVSGKGKGGIWRPTPTE